MATKTISLEEKLTQNRKTKAHYYRAVYQIVYILLFMQCSNQPPKIEMYKYLFHPIKRRDS